MHINLKKNNEIEWVFSWKELFLLFFKKGKFIITEASLDSFTVALIHIKTHLAKVKKDQK